MKKIFFATLSLVAGLSFLSSCNEEDIMFYEGGNAVHFVDKERSMTFVTQPESVTAVLEVPVQLVGNIPEKDLTFSVEVVEDEEPAESLFSIASDVEAEVDDLVEEKVEISVDVENDFSAKELEEAENSLEDFLTDERKAAVQYFSNENNENLIEVDEEMLTQDGELVVKTDLPLSMFDDTDSLEFVDDFAGMEKENDEDYGSFMFTDAIKNDGAAKRPIKKVTVDSSYLDFLASESEAEYNRNSQPVIEENDDGEDEDEAPAKRGFFRRK